MGQRRIRNGDRANFTAPHPEVIHPWAEAESGNKLCGTMLTTHVPTSPQPSTCKSYYGTALKSQLRNHQNANKHCGLALKTQSPPSPQPSERKKHSGTAVSIHQNVQKHCGTELKTNNPPYPQPPEDKTRCASASNTHNL